jgi:hypothetical protein
MDARVQTVCNNLINLSPSFGHLTEDNFYDLFVKPLKKILPFSIAADNGVSKGVLLIEGASQVIKIPFNARLDTDAYDDAICDYHYERESLPEEEWCMTKEPELEEFLTQFWCAGLRAGEEKWDYCEKECRLYALAQEEGLDQYFAKEYCVGHCAEGHPIYLQERAKIYCDSEESSRYTYEELDKIMETCDNKYVQCFNSVWIADFIAAHGEEEFMRLSAFLESYGIRDLHDGNLGYIDGFPVLVDYSNFDEW